MPALRLILGDQLSHTISSLRGVDAAHDTILMCEVMAEATYVKHHKKKIAFLFSAMRHFAAELADKGFSVRYIKLDDPGNTGSFEGEIDRALQEIDADHIVVTEPGEYRLLEIFKSWPSRFGMPVDIRLDDRFFCGIDEFKRWAEFTKQPRMEFFLPGNAQETRYSDGAGWQPYWRPMELR